MQLYYFRVRHCQLLGAVAAAVLHRAGRGQINMFRQGGPPCLLTDLPLSVVWTALLPDSRQLGPAVAVTMGAGNLEQGQEGLEGSREGAAATVYPAMTSSGIETGDQAPLTQRQNTIENLPTGKLPQSSKSHRIHPDFSLQSQPTSYRLSFAQLHTTHPNNDTRRNNENQLNQYYNNCYCCCRSCKT